MGLLLSFAAISPAFARDDLVIGISQFPAMLHPSIDSMNAKTYVLGFTRRPLTAFDPDWQLRCMLCVTLPTVENGLAKVVKTKTGTEMQVTFTLPPEARWGDGHPLTTEDVLFTWEVGRHPQSGVANAGIYRRIAAIEAKDKKTFVLHLEQATFDYNVLNEFRLLPAHLERAAFANPAEYRNKSRYVTDVANPGLSMGPYRVAKVEQGSQIVLEPNPQWWGKPPAFPRITVKAIENTQSLEANLLAGGVDMIAGEVGLPLDQAVSFSNRAKDAFEVVFKSGLIYEHIDINPANPALADKRVRKAILYGIDRQSLSRQMFDNRLPVADSCVSPLEWAYASDLLPYTFQPKLAASLLDAAGWRVVDGWVRKNAKGEPLVLELDTTAGNHTRELVQQVIQMNLRQLGIDVRLKAEPSRVFIGDTLTQRKFPGLAMYSWFGSPEWVPRATLHSASIPRAENNWSGQNFTGYADPRMDALIERIERELDRDKRRSLWREFQGLYAEELPALPLYFNAFAFILPKWLKGVRPTGHDLPSSMWAEEWRVEGR